MLTATQIAGFIGAGLAGAAYVPQLWHLFHVRCSAGISRLAFSVWLVASLLVTTHAVAMRAPVFIVLGVAQIVATALVLYGATRYASSLCAGHKPPSDLVLEAEPETAGSDLIGVVSRG